MQLIFTLTSATIWFLDKVQDGELKKTAMIDVKSDEVCTGKKEKHLYVTQFISSKDKYYCSVLTATQLWKDRIKSIDKNLQLALEISSGSPLP